MRFTLFLFIALLLNVPNLIGQKPKVYTSSDIAQRLQGLAVLGNVLYLAAHPDDENTRLITFLENEKNYRTAYLSLTRGDGGQNLIGSDIREKLGIIRTQELLQARSVDGGEQFFSRANDFGYSKHPDETFEIWDKEAVLSDVVYVIRKFKPDVIITRFNTIPGTTHGHHTASAILAEEAFEAAADPSRFSEQLATTSTWQPERLLWNTSAWFYKDKEDFDTSSMLKIDVGLFNPYLGKSYTEIAAESRSMHKSQGFGAPLQRGSSMEYLVPEKGSKPDSTLFEGINTSWSRVAGGAKIEKMVNQLIAEFNLHRPAEIVPELLKVYQAIASMPDNPFKETKLKEVKELIKASAGLYLEVAATTAYATPGDSVILSFETINRSSVPVQLEQISLLNGEKIIDYNKSLTENQKFLEQILIQLPGTIGTSQPYWLRKTPEKGMFRLEDKSDIGKPQNDAVLQAVVAYEIEGTKMEFEVPVIYKYTEPSEGEIYQPFSIVPAVALNTLTDKLLFTGKDSKDLLVEVVAAKDSVNGLLSLKVPEGWTAEPSSIPFAFLLKGASKTYRFKVTAPRESDEQYAEVVASFQGNNYQQGLEFISYPHIPTQVFLPQAKVKLVKMDLSVRGEKIGYLMGAGDDIPESLRQVGFQVDILQPADLELAKLKKYDAIVLGVRAFNTIQELKFKKNALEEYARKGGTVVIQYNTSFGLVDDQISPYKLNLSRKRITSEEAPVEILDPQHPVFLGPNKITKADFEGWVQERGLYFADSWSKEWTPLISSHDPGEEPLKGGLLVAKVGSGYYVYTSYSWFRQLPAGVPGAYRLFVNLLSLGKSSS